MRHAFTLIELIVTGALIVLLVGFLGATFLRSALPTTALRALSRDLAGDLRFAAQLATTTQVNHAVRLETQPHHRYRIIRLLNPEVELKVVHLPPPITFSSITLPENTATFNVLGAVLAAGSITLRHAAGQTATIEIRPSGYVR